MEFGVLCNGNMFQQWQLDSIRLLVGAGHTCKLLVVNANTAPKPGFLQKWIHYPWPKLLCRAWFRYRIKPEAKRPVDINTVFPDLPSMHCVTMLKGISEYFSPADVAYIKSCKLDFILRFGFGIIKGEILDAATYGVWSYHHDDDRKYRGVPTGFWEIMFGDPVNAVVLQRLTHKIDSGVILYKAYFATINHSWEANLNNILQGSVEWPLKVCRRIENGETEFLAVANAPETEIYKLPGNFRMLYFILKVTFNKLKFHFHDLFRAEKWQVGLLNPGNEGFISPGEQTLPEPEWIRLQAGKPVYHADPSGFIHQGCIHIICEEYDYRTAKGILVSMKLDVVTKQLIRKEVALEKDYHLAFPFVFEYENNVYCIPENSEGRNVDLYRYELESGKLSFEKTLVPDLKAVDPTLFHHNNLWWLFFTDKTSTNERLHAWYSENVFGPFSPHANNPVKVDIRYSRPAGIPFMQGGMLLRPAQDCSVRSGRRICINQVVRLSKTEFEEKEYAVLNPSPTSKYRDGMHTFNRTNGLIIVDAKRECFIWQSFAKKMAVKFNRFIK